MDNCTRCLSCWKSTHTYICFRHMPWTPKLPLCSKTILYLPVFSLVGLGGGGGFWWHNMWPGAVTCPVRRPPPTPSPLSQLPRQKLWSLISRWDQTGLRGGGGRVLFRPKPHQLEALRKTEIFRVRQHCQSKSFHGRPNSWTTLYGAPEVPGQEKETLPRVLHYQSNHQIWRKPMILLFCCFLLFPIEALYKQKNLKKLIFGWHLPYRNVTDPQPCLIKSVHFNKADHYFGFYEFFFYIQEGTGGAS